jgi:hypothetical protein
MKKIMFIILSIIVLLTTMAIIDAFNDIESKGLPQASDIAGQQYLDNVLSMSVGSGSNVLHADQSGLWLGANKFVDAPFSVDMLGALLAKSATFKDEADTTIIDAKGVVSTANFSFQTATPTGGTSTANAMESDSWDDVPNATITLTPTRTTNYLIGFTINAKNDSAADLVFFRFRIGSTTVGPQLLTAGNQNSTEFIGYETVSTSFIVAVASGTSILKVQYGTSGGGTAGLYVTYPYTAQLYAIKLGN